MLCFCSYRAFAPFSVQTLQFLLVGVQKYFLPRGAGHPSYATLVQSLQCGPTPYAYMLNVVELRFVITCQSLFEQFFCVNYPVVLPLRVLDLKT